ncbi:MAG: alkaline shock response membrane anchor protein AmaP [Acetivibrionales bacterium]|jgi:uncharacterized alkaline shock family protein YloU
MNILFRILLAIYAFCLALFSAFGLYIAIDPNLFVIISDHFTEILSTDGAIALRVTIFATAMVFFILSIMFLLSGVRSSKDKKAVSKHTNIGEIKISLSSIENIASHTCRRINGVKESKTIVRKSEDAVQIEARMIVMPDMSIPVISEEVQARVKKAVEEASGVMVKNVNVIVDNIYSGITYKARVE